MVVTTRYQARTSPSSSSISPTSSRREGRREEEAMVLPDPVPLQELLEQDNSHAQQQQEEEEKVYPPIDETPVATENHVDETSRTNEHDDDNVYEEDEYNAPASTLPLLVKQWRGLSNATKRRFLGAVVAFVYVFVMVFLSISAASSGGAAARQNTLSSSLSSSQTAAEGNVCSLEMQQQQPKPRNPILRLLQGARNRFGLKSGKRQQQDNAAPTCSTAVSTALLLTESGTSVATVLDEADRHLLRQWSLDALEHVPLLRSNQIGWDGSTMYKWFAGDGLPRTIPAQIEGGKLLYAYYKVMVQEGHLAQYESTGLVTFPDRLCSALTKTTTTPNGSSQACPPYRALEHTLQWRRAYQPWRMNPSALDENKKGWVYARGFSPAATDYGQHSMVWIRPGLHKAQDPLDYLRCLFSTLERAIAQALEHSNGRIGKFNVLVDATDYEWSKLPEFSYVWQGIRMLQDHYPDRLGVLAVVHTSRTAEVFYNMVRHLLSEQVQAKIVFLSDHDPVAQAAELAALVEPAWLPTWLGGTDTYEFDPIVYYANTRQDWTDEQSREFQLTTMPY